jgi:hypothetical protein
MGRRAEKLNLLARAVAGSRVMAVIRVLPYLLVTLIIISPLALTTTWDPFLAYYGKAWEAFGDGRVVDGLVSLLQIVLLTIPIAGLALVLMLVGKRLGTAAWNWSEGKPVLRTGLSSARFGLVIIAVVAAGVTLFTLPNVDKAKPTGRILKDQVATLLVGDDKTANASSSEADSETSDPKSKLYSILTETILPPQLGEEREADSTSSDGQTSEQANETASPSSSAATPENPDALAPKEPVPAVVTAPPTSTEEPAATPTTAPPTEPTITEPPPDSPPPSESPPPSGSPPQSESPPSRSPPSSESPPPSGSSPPPQTPPGGNAPPNAPTTQMSLHPSPNPKYLSFSYP